jgi:hypothetical protein
MKKNVTVDLCDVCESGDVLERLAVGQCAICEKSYCSSAKHRQDEYFNIQHIRYEANGSFPFVCIECWEKAQAAGGLPSLVDGRFSGSSWACHFGDFFLWHKMEANKIVCRFAVQAIKELIEHGEVKLQEEKRLKEIEDELLKRLEDVREKGKA